MALDGSITLAGCIEVVERGTSFGEVGSSFTEKRFGRAGRDELGVGHWSSVFMISHGNPHLPCYHSSEITQQSRTSYLPRRRDAHVCKTVPC